MPTKFTLPISPAYVQHWGLWEAFREILQNAYDERDRVATCSVTVVRDPDCLGGRVHVHTSTGKLEPSMLILGNSTKGRDPAMRGKFGEGFKLALLVLTRTGRETTIANGNEKWTARIEHDEQFGCEVLNVYVYVEENWEERPGVLFSIAGITSSEWELLQNNIRHATQAEDQIMLEPVESGRLYVGGLFVAHMKGFRHGYALRAGSISLDRDRGLVSGFDLSYLTSRIWTDRKEADGLVDTLLEKKAPDVEYVTCHATKGSPIVGHVASSFASRHGPDAVPVSTQPEVERATAAGVRWVLVPELVKKLIGKVVSLFIPTRESPSERLQRFIEENRWNLNEDQLRELEGIASAMGGQVSADAPRQPSVAAE